MGVSIPVKFVKRRIGDLPAYYCSPKKAFKDLSWKSIKKLNDAIKDIKSTI